MDSGDDVHCNTLIGIVDILAKNKQTNKTPKRKNPHK